MRSLEAIEFEAKDLPTIHYSNWKKMRRRLSSMASEVPSAASKAINQIRIAFGAISALENDPNGVWWAGCRSWEQTGQWFDNQYVSHTIIRNKVVLGNNWIGRWALCENQSIFK